MMLPRRLRTQVTLGAALISAVVVALAGLAIAIRIDHQDRSQLDEQLRARAMKVLDDSHGVGGHDPLFDEADKPQSEADLLAGTESLTRVLSGSQVVVERGESIAGPIPLPSGTGLSTVTISGQAWRSLVEAMPSVPDGQLQILQSLQPVEQRLADNRRLIAIVAVFATLLTGVGAWFLSGLVLRPLERLRHGAQAIGPGNSEQRLPEVRRPQEIAELSATLNSMLQRLELSMEATRRFTADAGHELRTPLTGLGADLETLQRNPNLPVQQRQEMLDAMTVEHSRIVALLGGLQQLARGDAEAVPGQSAAEINQTVDEAVSAARRRHPGITYEVASSPDEVVVAGWPEGLRSALENLLDNAALHGKAGGRVTTSVSVEGGSARIDVSDDGPGIPAAQREAMKERFARGPDPNGPGSGLGLALVDQQARLHGGSLELKESSQGGLLARVSLPLRVG
jgi:two-component system, OmpR family, sensor histidine kinase PrrB